MVLFDQTVMMSVASELKLQVENKLKIRLQLMITVIID